MDEKTEKFEKGPSVTQKMRDNPWMVSTLILGIITVIFLISIITRGGVTGASTGTVSESEVEGKIMDFVKSQVGDAATLVSTEVKNGLYEVTVSYQGQEIPIYMTLDGKNLVQGVTPYDLVIQQANGASNTEPVSIEVGDSPVKGSDSAKVTVIEFTDFSCPYCQAASGFNEQMAASMKSRDPTWEPIVSNLFKDYVNSGKVKFVSKYSMGHSGGRPAQLVAWCLYEQNSNMFWKYYQEAFSKTSEDVENLDSMKELAKNAGGDMNKLQACLDGKKYDSYFDKEQQQGVTAGVSGTPAFFINGRLVEGAVSYTQFKQIVDEELAKVA